jgi:hypothetical protein
MSCLNLKFSDVIQTYMRISGVSLIYISQKKAIFAFHICEQDLLLLQL